MRMTMENWTHKPHRQGFFSSNAIANIQLMKRSESQWKGELLSPESPSSWNIVRVDVWVVNQWWIRMIFRRKFCIPKICSPRSIQATHAHACHSEVSARFFGFWSPRPFVAASCNKGHEVMKNYGDWDLSLRGLEVGLPAFQLPVFAKCDALPKGDLFSMMDMFV